MKTSKLDKICKNIFGHYTKNEVILVINIKL